MVWRGQSGIEWAAVGLAKGGFGLSGLFGRNWTVVALSQVEDW